MASEEHYQDWRSEHIGDLEEQFIEEREEEFNKYCRDAFKDREILLHK